VRSLLRLVLNNLIATSLIVLLLVVAGFNGLRHMSVDLFPDLNIPVVNVISHFIGASPNDIEQLVTKPIEQRLQGIPGVKRVASTSTQDISQITVEFSWGTSIQDARQQVQASLAQLQSQLPTNVLPRIENIGTTLQEVSRYIVYGTNDLVTLRNIISHDLAGRLMSVNGVSSVQVIGGEQRAFYVAFKPEALMQFRVSINQLVTTLQQNNISAVSGYLEQSGQEYVLRANAKLNNLADLRVLPVPNIAGKPVMLADLATIYEGLAPKHYVVHGNGKPAVAFTIRKQVGANTLSVVNGVDHALLSLTALLPKGVHIEKFYDQSQIIKQSQNEITNDLLLGAVLAIVVLYFFIGSAKPTLIVAATIPITFLATLAIMHWLGIGLNVITMAALTLAIGMIVDDAIVVSENIYRHYSVNANMQTASLDGTLEVFGADASGTFTTIAAFSPFIWLTGIAGLFMRPFGITVSAALFISLLLSLTLVPLLFSRLSAPSIRVENFAGARLLARFNQLLQRCLAFCFQRSKQVLGATLLFVLVACSALMFVTINVLPPIDEGAILVEYVMPPGTSLTESNRIGDKLDNLALAQPDVTTVYRRTGSPAKGYQIEGVNKGEMMLKLTSQTQRQRSVAKIIQALKKSYSVFKGVVFIYHQPTQEKMDESFSGLPALFGVTIYGTDQQKLTQLATQVESLMSTEPVISNIVNNSKVTIPQINIKMNYPALTQYGVDVASILNTLSAARFGIEATQIVRQKEQVAVMVTMQKANLVDIHALEALPIVTANGHWLPLAKLATISIGHAAANITRLNGQRQLTLIAEVDGNLISVAQELQQKLKKIPLPKGYSIDISGQYHDIIKLAVDLLLSVLAATLFIYLIMVMQFKDWKQPLVILITIPISLASSSIGLLLTGQSIDISVAMGVVTLVGIAVNNAIVLIDFFNKQRLEQSISQALLTATGARLRPILLTSITTIAALLPAAIGTTAGSNVFQPFAITVTSGLIGALIATLIVIPTMLQLITAPKQSHYL